MKTERFKIALLSILIITSLAVFLLAAIQSKPIGASPSDASTSDNFLAIDDSGVAEGYPDTNYGEIYNMYNGWVSGSFLSERTYIKFNLSEIPIGSIIDNAVLWVNSKYGPSAGEPDYLPTTHLIDAMPVNNDDWGEKTITWSNAPPMGSTVLDTENFQADDYVGQYKWYSWDVASYVASEFASGDSLVSIGLKGQNEGTYNSAGWFYSKTGDYPPYLQVSWHGAKMELSISPRSQTGTPGGALEYTVTVTNKTGTEGIFDLAVDSEWETSLPSSVGPISDNSSEDVTLSVTVPYAYGVQDEITVTATSQENSQIRVLKKCVTSVPGIYPSDDAYVIQQQPDNNTGSLDAVYVGTIISHDIWENRRGYFKFNLDGKIPSGATIDNAWLSIYTHYGGENGYPYGSATFTVDAKKVEDVSWDEGMITWNNAPPMGDLIDSKVIPPIDDQRYQFDITSYAQDKWVVDKEVSIGLVSEQEGQNKFTPFSSKDTGYSGQEPYLVVYYTPSMENRKVTVSISPSENSAKPGEDVTFTVTVKNDGNVPDTYSLSTVDNAGWGPILSEDLLVNVQNGASQTVTLTVTIPVEAENDTKDSITITVTSQENSQVSDNASCIAHVIVKGRVEVTIEPTSKSGAKGETLNYSVTISNVGTDTDTFSLWVMDTNGWGPALSVISTTLKGGASRTGIKLSIKIPDNVADGDSTTIAVTARGTGYDNSATCTAKAVGESSMWVYVGVAVAVIVMIIAVVLILKPF